MIDSRLLQTNARCDVITLEAGDAVPADCRLLRADGLEVDESRLTGESGLVGKTAQAAAAHAVADRRSMAYEGTAIAAGRALAVAVSTGEQTELGRSAKLGLGADRTTGVARRLRSLTKITVPVRSWLGMDLLRGRPLGRALGISHFFGCRPLWPHLWLLALGCSAAATVAAMLTQRG